LIEQLSVLQGTVLAATARVMYQSSLGALLSDAAKQRLADQVFGYALAHGVTHQIATE